MAKKKRPLPVSEDYTIIVREPRNDAKKQFAASSLTVIQPKRNQVLPPAPFSRNIPRKGDFLHRRVFGEGCSHVAPDKSLEEPGPSGVTTKGTDIEVHIEPPKKKNRLFEPLAQLRFGLEDNRKLKCCIRCNSPCGETVAVEVKSLDNKPVQPTKPVTVSVEPKKPDGTKPVVDKLLERQKRFAIQPLISLPTRTPVVESAPVSDRSQVQPKTAAKTILQPSTSEIKKALPKGLEGQKKDIHKPDTVPTEKFKKKEELSKSPSPPVFPALTQEVTQKFEKVHPKTEKSPKKEDSTQSPNKQDLAREETSIVHLVIPDSTSEGTQSVEMKLGKRISFPGRNACLEGAPLMKKQSLNNPNRAPSPSALLPHLQNPPTRRIVAASTETSPTSAEYIELKAEPRIEPKPEEKPIRRETIKRASPPPRSFSFADRYSKPTIRKEETRRDDIKKEISPERAPKINFVNPRAIKGKDGKKFLPFFTNKYVFSNHFPCPGLLINGKKFCCTEQYYMWRKAKFARNEPAAGAIYMSTDPKQMKLIGSSLGDFDDAEWTRLGWKYMVEANYAKYKQFDELRFQLLRTIGTTLVEANPTDKYWGVGLSLDSSHLNDPSRWHGENALGRILMEIREHIQETQQYQHEVVRARRSLIVNDL